MRVTSDGHDAYPSAIIAVFGKKVRHRTSHYIIIWCHLVQDHRGINNGAGRWGALRVSNRPHGFAGRMTKSGTFCVCALAAMRAYQWCNDGCFPHPVPVFFRLHHEERLVTLHYLLGRILIRPSQGAPADFSPSSPL